MSRIDADADGFLTGKPIDGEGTEASQEGVERLLTGIKGDTAGMLDALQAQGQANRRASLAARLPAQQSTVTPAGRSSAAERARDAAGRFVGATGRATSVVQAASSAATAASSVARTVAADRRDRKADAAAGQPRGADGRFGAGGRPHAGLLAGRASAAVLHGADRVDPLLASMAEARAVVAPIGRAGSAMFGGGAANDDPPGLLRRVWRELRGMRKDEAKTSRDTLRKLKDVEEAASRTGSSGPGLLQSLLSALPGGGLLKNLLPGGATPPGAAAGAGAALKGMLKRLPVIGGLFEAVTGVVEDQRIANDAALSEAEKRRLRGENAGGTAGALAGAVGGAAALSWLGPAGLIVGGIGGGLAGSDLGKRAGGWISGMFESGRGGAGTVSTGRGDHGGKSYGTHQLSSRAGTLQRYLASTPYGAQFEGLTPGSAAFDAKWKALAASDPAFAASQHDFMRRTHVDPLAARLKSAGIDLSGRGQAVQEMLWSTATQFGPGTDVVKRALSGMDLSSASDAAIITAVQDYKAANNSTLFRSSPQLQPSLLNRAVNEKSALLALAAQSATPATVAGLGPARLPALPTVPVLPPVPQLDPLGEATKLNSDKPLVVQLPTAPASQDVADRTIAHIVTGGIGGGLAHR